MSQPSKPRLRPIAALRAVRKLMRNGEDTQQVFLLIEGLRGKTTLRQFARFRQTEIGRAVLGENRRLLDRLSDRASLAALPAGTLGRGYYDFMAAEDLSAEGLVEMSKITRPPASDDVTQTGLKGFAVIAVYAARKIARSRPDQPVRRAVVEGYRHGRSAGWLPGADWEALLDQPVEAIRARFAVKPPTYYRTIMAALRRPADHARAVYADPSVQPSS